jgi:Co/Zn/Cd efflux system component
MLPTRIAHRLTERVPQTRRTYGWRPVDIVALVTALWFGVAAVIVAAGVFLRLVP